MTPSCPYMQTSYASWRRKAISSLLVAHEPQFLRTSHIAPAATTATTPSRAQAHSFSTTSASQNAGKPAIDRNARRRQRKKDTEDEVAKLLNLQSEVSKMAARYVGLDVQARKGLYDLEEPVNLDRPKPSKPDADAQTQTQTQKPSEALPKSFLELRLAAKEEKKPKKRLPTRDEKNHLRYNAYAQALASPIRVCHATGVRLPSAFLTGWGLVQHPETKHMWLMPTELLSTRLRKPTKRGQEKEEAEEAAAAASDAADQLDVDRESANRREQEEMLESGAECIRPRTYIPPVYYSTSADLMKSLSSRSKRQVGRWLIPSRWKQPLGQLNRTDEKNTVWREDMPEFMLRVLQEEAVTALQRAQRLRKDSSDDENLLILDLGEEGGVEKLKGALDNMEATEAFAIWGAVLILRPNGVVSAEEKQRIAEDIKEAARLKAAGIPPPTHSRTPEAEQGQGPDADDKASSTSSSSFPDEISLPGTAVKVPIFDLTRLFTREQLEELRQGAGGRRYFRYGALFLQPAGALSRKMIENLWRLKCYVGGSDYRQV